MDLKEKVREDFPELENQLEQIFCSGSILQLMIRCRDLCDGEKCKACQLTSHLRRINHYLQDFDSFNQMISMLNFKKILLEIGCRGEVYNLIDLAIFAHQNHADSLRDIYQNLKKHIYVCQYRMTKGGDGNAN